MVKVIEQDGQYWTEADCDNFQEIWDHPVGITQLEPLGSDFPIPILRLCRHAKPFDFFVVGSLRVVSNSLKELFISSNAVVEFFEVQLYEKSGDIYEHEQFYFAHLLKEVDCFDFERSVYETYRWGDVRHAEKVVLREEGIDDTPVFRMTKAYFGTWLCSEDFARRIKASDLRGMVFTDIDSHVWGLRSSQ